MIVALVLSGSFSGETDIGICMKKALLVESRVGGVEAGMCRAGRVGDSPSNNGTSEGVVDRMRLKTKS